MVGAGYKPTSLSVLKFYEDIIDIFIGDTKDKMLKEKYDGNIDLKFTNTTLNSIKDKINLSKYILEL